MASFSEIRDAIKAVLAVELPEIFLYATVPEAVNLPAVVVAPAEAEFPLEMGRATDVWQFDLIVMTSFGDAELAQNQLDAYLSGGGVSSIRQALMRNRQLGRLDVMTAYVSGMSDYGTNYTMAAVENIACKLRVIVKTTAPDW